MNLIQAISQDDMPVMHNKCVDAHEDVDFYDNNASSLPYCT